LFFTNFRINFMSEFQKRLDNLSTEKRELLLLKLQKQTATIEKHDRVPSIESVPRDRVLPLSFAQQRLWFLDRLEGESTNYNMAAAVRLTGSLQVSTLARSIEEIVHRHEIIRTNFQTINGTAVQIVAPTLNVTLPIMDLQTLMGEEQSTEIQRLAKEEADRPFDLANEPLFRATLLQLKPAEHLLLLTMHHIICDGWSIEIFLDEMSTCYEAFLVGSPSPLTALPIQYADFAYWQRQRLQGELLENGISYWKQKLAGAPPLLSLPTDYPRPHIQTFQGNVEYFQIDANLTKKLNSFSRQSGVTLFMTMLTAFATLLCRYSNQSDIIIGSPIANRDRKELENLIGFFVNTLLLRIDLEGNPSFSELLNRVRQTALDAYDRQDIPFEKIVEELNPLRTLSYNPLFQVMFALQNMSQPKPELTDLNLTLEMENVTAKFDLSLSIEETEQELRGVWEYNTDLFNAATIQQMIGNFLTLLEEIVASPQQQIDMIPVLTDYEQKHLLVEWNNTYKKYPQDLCIHQLIEGQAARTPDRIAVVFEDVQLTYEEVNQKANQLACLLSKKNIAKGNYVPVLMEKSLELLISHLAIMKTGAAFVPMDAKWPLERIKEILSELNSPVVLVGQEQSNCAALAECSWIVVDETKLSDVALNLDISMSVDDPIYTIFTSGSTGKPKGAINQHRGIVNRFFNMNDRYGCQENDVILFTSNHLFDASVWQLFWPLINGARTVIPAPTFGFDLNQIVTLIAKEQVTITDFVPSVFNILVDYISSDRKLHCQLNSLRQLLIGGEAMSSKAIYQFKSYFPSVGITNTYGPTETSIGVIFHEVSPQFTEPIPIGKPLNNVYALILDKHLNLLPIGVAGELYLGGQCVGLGYLNNDTVTQSVFITNPFIEIDSKLLYKTGDLARYLPDGTIEFLGRIDNQVKIRGIRIELGEIEAVLMQHSSVKHTAVVLKEDQSGNKRLVSYVVANQKQELTNTILRHFLKEKLPEYMVPSVFLMLDSFPLTPNGKIDWRSLPSPDFSKTGLEDDFVSPRTDTEEILSKLWAEVLGLETVGINNNFFELGGDSILSIQVVARANQAGLLFTPKQLFQHQTIAELASVVSETPQIQAEQGLITGQIPLTPIQHWFFAENPPEPHHYNQSVLLEVLSDLIPELLELTLQQCLAHHDALRLKFVPSTSGWQQVNASVDEIPVVSLTVVDLADLSANRQLSEIEASAAELQTSLDLLNGSIFKAVLFQLGQDKPGRLLLVIHHLAIDGVSWRILLEDLATVYQQLSEGRTVQLPHKTTSFQDWSYRLAEYGKSENIDREWNYWLNRPAANTSLPVDYSLPQATNTVDSAAQVSVSLSEQQTRALLQEVPPIYNTQINDVLLAALWQTFFQWTGERSLLIDLESHGREELFPEVDLSRTIGWFTAVFPVQLHLGETDHPEEILKSVKEQLRHIQQQGIGYGILRYLSHDPIKKSQLAALQPAEVSFNYLGQLDRALSQSPLLGMAKESCGAEQSPSQNRSYLLEVNCYIVDRQLQMDWVYNKNIHQQSTVTHLSQGFIESLNSLISHCQSAETGYTPSDFPAARLSQKELDKLAAKINPN
jgi:amino acid adenylation domain-containing protein/non-ribosomal peptide synthase protein (TIGR01720 family)